MSELDKYEVTLRVRNPETQRIDHQWTVVFHAENFGHAQEQAEDVLRDNKDSDSKVERIELW